METRVSRDAVEVETGRDPQAAVIWLHGLGADGHDFEPIVPQLMQPADPALRFVFPHAPVRPVTLNGGYAMRAWYDIVAIDRRTAEDASGIRASQTAISQWIRGENARGISTSRIVLAGFSQGGALALFTGTRYPERLAGLIGLSCYLLLSGNFPAERQVVNAATPIFLAHGTYDPIVDPAFGAQTRATLEAAGHSVEWHSYPMPHAVCPEEVVAIAAFLRRVLTA
jgi:phospholipase/carboxylesterase